MAQFRQTKRQKALTEKTSDPGDEVSQSKCCKCFGYLSCEDCYKDCLGQCNLWKLCCNCDRCLSGTCQCFKVIGCDSWLTRIGCTPQCVGNTCRQDAPFCIMVFKGVGVMFCAIVACAISVNLYSAFSERYTVSNALSEEEYSCFFVSGKVAGEDIAPEIKDVMFYNQLVYMIIAVGTILSCIGGPIICMRWFAVTFHLLIGMFLHAAAIFYQWLVVNSDGGEYCMKEDVGVPIAVREDALFLKDQLTFQYGMFFVITIAATIGCYQSKLRDALVMKKTIEKRNLFKQNQLNEKNKKMREFELVHQSRAENELIPSVDESKPEAQI